MAIRPNTMKAFVCGVVFTFLLTLVWPGGSYQSCEEPHCDCDSKRARQLEDTAAPPPAPRTKVTRPSAAATRPLNFELPPLPTPVENLTNKMEHPSKWPGANWGPVKEHVDWSTAETPLWRRELHSIQAQKKFPRHPASGLNNGDVLYAKSLAVFRNAIDEAYTILEVGLHPAVQNRVPLFGFFREYLPKAKYMLFANGMESPDGDLAEHLEQNPEFFHKGQTSEAKNQVKVQEAVGSVDIIVGRAADGIAAQLDVFRYFFVNMLRPGGVYFIEDVDMNFISTPDTDECVKTRTLMIDYLRDIMSAQMNHDWKDKFGTAGDYRADPFVNNWVLDVACSRGGCVVTKRLKPFDRRPHLVISYPVAAYETPFQTKRPAPLGVLLAGDPNANNSVSLFGPMSRPVKLGSHNGELPLWATEANTFKVLSDKGGSDKSGDHQFHLLYSKVLAPWREALVHRRGQSGEHTKDWKMLEIGLGCDMTYAASNGDPAGGYRLFGKFIPNVEYFVFEFKWAQCLKKLKKRPHLQDLVDYLSSHVQQGDQSNYGDLKKTIGRFGTFDVIVDDASHISHMMISTFRELFIAGLKPGGLFVIEDLHTCFAYGSAGKYFGATPEIQKQRLTAIDILRDMIVSLNYPSWQSGYRHSDPFYRADEPVLNWVEDIICGREACVIQKRLQPLSNEL